jgi:hypothetical protein
MFLRPRRWGKSTFLHMLANYYDKNHADQFTDTFGQLYIGKKPTPYRSSYLVLLFDFSLITTNSYEESVNQLHEHVNEVLEDFLRDNGRHLGNPDYQTLTNTNGALSLRKVLVSIPQWHLVASRVIKYLTDIPTPALGEVER